MKGAVTTAQSVRAGSISGYAELVTSLGQNPLELLAEAGLPRECLLPDREDDYLPLSGFEAALALAAERSGTPEFAVLLGSRQKPQALLGALGFAMQHSSSLGAALGELRRYFFFQVRGARLDLAAGENEVSFSFVLSGDPAQMAGLRYSAELSLGAGLSVMRQLVGPRWSPGAVHFFHGAPADNRVRATYQQLFDCPVRWNQPANSMVFPRSDLDRPLASADRPMKRLVHPYLERLRREYRDDVKAQTALMIDHALKSGHCSIEQVASLCGVHRRTLHRQLQAEGTTFSELLDQVRQQQSRQLLVDSDMSVAAIAEVLCYSETSAFTRACRRWFGSSPRALRERLRSGGGLRETLPR